MKKPTYTVKEFLSFIRTKQFFQNRLKDHNKDSPVFISINEIRERFWKYPNRTIEVLKQDRKLGTQKKVSSRGYVLTYYRTLVPVNIDLSLLKPVVIEYDGLHKYLMECLLNVSISSGSETTEYFTCFLSNKDKHLGLFFSVDKFSNRVHTPITNLKKEYRRFLLIQQEQTVSIDVVAMQPMILGMILFEQIGENQFTDWLVSGLDVYTMIQEIMILQDRDTSKEQFFQILFSYPNNKLVEYFGNSSWITWINNYKRKRVDDNPYTIRKPHSNLAWLLQSNEVRIMRKVWSEMRQKRIVFLTVHDEIIVKSSDSKISIQIMQRVLESELPSLKIKLRIKENENI